ncbi:MULTISPECIES: preprotein translocase subunit SecG [Wohlfahrtiimonas]|uniref:preprotein translocase subunit SecG n=1 Tax=Wohlfahrtiimonas TaxID=582472 RepID=UPI0007B6973E|nr:MULTISPECIES: preprotein translocase subunit SecG [Wohlfahrtiimonas]KZX37582.1 preprotein translocase subunit SecG [Wohlfahrtiimonas chitiniclastica]MBS7817556.1 preprotein translocase subunit SecG [Wohlfahrtiimonas chitiniclastica]MBS7823383.1 preprotein translocase subunit SecG [Wohlfahrtiimonas chitiniclastica]MBS7831197.1 preprotein translocase subunit SecG [Wohlfahrtiimonas chitiniclastica]MBS7833164.1 preprotein translocase subunit SecG [Wohlfahrtiimonas chitiniclastica]
MVLTTIITVIHVIVALCIVGLVLIQHGKGADAGTAFGSGASGTVFGAAGKSNFLARMTKWLVVVFFLTSFSMMVLYGKKATIEGESVLDVPAVSIVPTIEDLSVPSVDPVENSTK